MRKKIFSAAYSAANLVLFCARLFFGDNSPRFWATHYGRLKMAKKNAAPTKSEVLTQISKDTGLSRKQVGEVFESLSGVIKKSLRGNGLFTVPGLMKLKAMVN